jgi:hypothetical protein
VRGAATIKGFYVPSDLTWQENGGASLRYSPRSGTTFWSDFGGRT